MRKSLFSISETELAAYQTRQEGNTCSFHVIAASLRLLLDLQIDPMSISAEVNRLWWRGRFMRVVPNWAVTPQMQVRIVRYLAQTRGLPITAEYQTGTSQRLQELLANPEGTCIPIITLIWLWRQAPPIYFANTTLNFNRSYSAGGHSMLLAAYDRDHWAENKFRTPWGFINPWMDDATHLFWMREVDFLKAWRFRMPGIGPNPLVLIRRRG
jgi:hypothetical protein